MGEHDLSTEEDCEGKDTPDEICAPRLQEFRIEEVIAHKQYNSPKLYQNDIALIRVDRDIDFRFENVKPICLPIGSAAKILGSKVCMTFYKCSNSRPQS